MQKFLKILSSCVYRTEIVLRILNSKKFWKVSLPGALKIIHNKNMRMQKVKKTKVI